ncbi:MAG: caspase family protein [Chloroflexota bacterium]
MASGECGCASRSWLRTGPARYSVSCLLALALCLALGVISSPRVFAQGPSQGSFSSPERWAVMVGVSQYQYLDDLHGPAKSATALSDVLRPIFGEGHVLLLTDSQATKDGIRRAVSEWLVPREDADDTVLFFFCGHGSSNAYLAPYDSLTYSWANDIAASELDRWLDALDGRQSAVVLDVCHAGAFFSGLSGPGRVVIGSSSATETSAQASGLDWYSIFAYYLLQAFDNLLAVDSNADHETSAEELFRYVAPKVSSYRSTQNPQMNDGYTGDLPLFETVTVSFDMASDLPGASLPRIAVEWKLGPRSGKGEIRQGSYTWAAGTRCTFSVPAAPVAAGEGRRLVFGNWNDGPSETSRTVTVSESAAYIAYYRPQYYLTVTSPFGQPSGEGWYDQGARATVSVPEVVDHGDGSRHRFLRWSGDFTTTSPQAEVVVDSPKKVTADYGLQYYLAVTAPFGQSSGEGWYDQGARATVSVPEVVDHGDDSRHRFLRWSGDSSGTSVHAEVLMDSARKVIADYGLQYYMEVTVTPQGAVSVPGAGWYDAGDHALVGPAEGTVGAGEGIRYVFVQGEVEDMAWDGNAVSIYMNTPLRAQAAYQLQYQLTVESEHGGQLEGGWYEAGSRVSLSVPPTVGVIRRYIFQGWTGDISSETPAVTVVMNGPVRLAAQWRTDYLQLYALVGGVVLLVAASLWVVEARRRKA